MPRLNADLNDIFVAPDTGDIWIAGDGGFLAVSHDNGATWLTIDPTKQNGAPAAPAAPQQQSSWWSPRNAFAEAAPPPVPDKQRASTSGEKEKHSEQLAPASANPSSQSPPASEKPATKLPVTPANKKPERPAVVASPQAAPPAPTPSPEEPARPMGSDASKIPGADTLIPIEAVNFQRVYFERGGRGWVLGDDGTVLRTSNGGASWSRTNLGAPLFGIAVVGGTEWFTTGDGQIFRVDVSGKVERHAVAIGAPWDISFSSDGSVGWVAGRGRDLFVTRDGSNWFSFRPATESLAADTTFSAVQVEANGKRAWALANDGTLVRIQQDGAGWTAAVERPGTPGSSYADLALDAASGSIWSVGDNYVALRSAGGDLTSKFDLRNVGNLRAVASSPSGQAWAAGSSGTVVSIDRSGTIRTVAGGWRSDLRDIAFAADGAIGLAAGDSGVLVSTIDGGETWHQESSPADEVGRVAFVGGQPAAILAGVGVLGRIATGTLGPEGWAWKRRVLGPKLRGISGIAIDPAQKTLDEPLRAWFSTLGGSIWRCDEENCLPVYESPALSGGYLQETTLYTLSFAADGRHGIAVGEVRNLRPYESAVVGVILRTNDGGASWSRSEGTGAAPLTAVTMLSPSDAWIVGTGGTVLRATGDREAWEPQSVGAGTTVLSDIAFAPDRNNGWIVGDDGFIAATRNGGRSWSRQDSGTDKSLSEIHVHSDGKRAWIAGNEGLILRTTDGGTTWRRVSYAKIAPAPWFFAVSLLIIGLLIVPALLVDDNEFDGIVPTIAAVAVSDRPLEPGQQDRLNTRGLARGLARFLGNESTQARLTIGIMGGWGSGKSSIMNETRAELARYGFYSAWFNAWHHQTEENLLASLFETIRKDALPSFWKLDLEGVRFRWRLLLIRLRRQWLPWFFLAVLAVFAAGHVSAADDSVGYLGKWLGQFLEWLPFVTAPEAIGSGRDAPRLVAIIALLGSARLAWNGLSTFGVSPSLIVSRLTGQMHVGDLKANPGLRQQFKIVFADVVEALQPRPLALFVDDLDRCLPDKTLNVLEVVNFLMTAGDCYVVIGMDRERVEGCIGMAFNEVAKFLDQDAAADTPAEERINARNYARQYLDKLINIEVSVPTLGAEDARNLVRPDWPQASERPGWPGVLRSLARRFAPLALVLAVLFLVWNAGNRVPQQQWPEQEKKVAEPAKRAIKVDGLIREIQSHDESERLIGLAKIFVLYPEEAARVLGSLPQDVKGELERVQKSAKTGDVQRLLTAMFLAGTEQGKALGLMHPNTLSTDLKGLAGTPSVPETGPTPDPNRRPSAPPAPRLRYLPGEDDRPGSWLWLFGVTVAGLALSSLRLLSAPLPPERDSPRFSEALAHWIALVHEVSPTPRGLKRFVNRVRYYAMRQQKADSPLRLGERLRALLRHSPADPEAPAANGEPIPEDVLVALSAIQQAKPNWLKDPKMWSNLREFMQTRVSEVTADLPEHAPADIAKYEAQFRSLAAGIIVR